MLPRELVEELHRRQAEMYAGGSTDGVAELLADDITAVIGGESVGWRTVGIYRLQADRVAEVWLVPIELQKFDRVWRVGA